MTRRTTKIAALRPIAASRFALHVLILLSLLTIARTARANTYYIDYASGSNSNPGTKASPWKSHPFMQTGSACTGGVTGWSGWTHATGDHYIFKGGVTWPAACFTMNIPAGGNSSAQDYYGVDITWFNGGSWTRPLWDMAYTNTVGDFIVEPSSGNTGYMTFDNIEVAHQLVTIYNNMFEDFEAFQFQNGAPGTILENMYIHDWATNTNLTAGSCPQGCAWYDVGSVNGSAGVVDPTSPTIGIRLLNSTISDQNGYYFVNGVKHAGGFGGGFRGGYEAGGDTFAYTAASCFDTYLCHDSFFNHPDGSEAIYDTNSGGATGIHTQVIEDDGGGNSVNYNNYIVGATTAVTTLLCPGSPFFNNVATGSTNQAAIRIDSGFCFATTPASATELIYNNTVDGTAAGASVTICVRPTNGSCGVGGTIGTVDIYNNIFLNGGVAVQGTITHYNNSNNRAMNSTEANTYGFVIGNKYKPSSADPNASGAGVNLTSSCTGSLTQLCQDASGAPWFGGAPITRPTGSTGWDLGAFQGQGGAVGPPSISISSPSPGTISGSVNLTASCTPQGSATVGSIQFTIDGDTFGAAGTASPYTLSWNTLTAANATHTVSATCTDSNSQTGTASTVTVTVSNSMPGCFVSTDNGSGSLSWTANQSFTVQTTNFTATLTATPNTANQDTVIALSQSPMAAYSQGTALIRFNSSGTIDVYKGSIANYAADATVTYTPGTTYAFTFTVNMTAGTYTVALTSPSSVTLATSYSFRTTAPAASLGFLNAVSDDTTPDTSQVCGFALAGSTSLTFNPASLNLGSVTVGGNGTQSITTTTTGGSVNFTSVAISGNADFTIASNTCTGSIPSSCTTQIKFAPTSASLETATVTYTDDATGNPQAIAVSGTGVPPTPTLSVNPASLSFGGVQIHVTSSSGPIVLTITSGPVTFTGTPSLSGANAADFALASNTCTGTVSAASCQTVVSFTPSAVGAEFATLTYTDNATGSPQSVALVGTGYLAPHPPTAVHATVE